MHEPHPYINDRKMKKQILGAAAVAALLLAGCNSGQAVEHTEGDGTTTARKLMPKATGTITQMKAMRMKSFSARNRQPLPV